LIRKERQFYHSSEIQKRTLCLWRPYRRMSNILICSAKLIFKKSFNSPEDLFPST
jgi:hypothetical protein